LKFSNKHCKFLTEFSQIVANFRQQQFIMDVQNFFFPKFFQNESFLTSHFAFLGKIVLTKRISDNISTIQNYAGALLSLLHRSPSRNDVTA